VLYLFHKSSCGPCQIVDEFLKTTGDTRVERINKVNLEAGIATEEELELGQKYGVHSTPVLTVTNHDDVVIEEHEGALNITRNLRRILELQLGG